MEEQAHLRDGYHDPFLSNQTPVEQSLRVIDGWPAASLRDYATKSGGVEVIQGSGFRDLAWEMECKYLRA